MIQLINVDIEEFKKTIYPEYVKIFPKEERKELQNIEKNYDKEITKFIKICKNNEFIEFFIINTLAIYILPISVQKNNENEILENMFQIYYSVHGKEKVERECQVI